MHPITVGVSTLNQTPLAWDANKANILDAIAQAQDLGVTILCLPEMCISGYGCEDAFLSFNTQEMALEVLHEIIPNTNNLIVSLSVPIRYRDALYNCACLVADCSIAGFVAKRFLASQGIHYEPRWFQPWPQNHRDIVNIHGINYPIGDLYFDCGGVKIGFEICEDAWVSNRPGHRLADHEIDLILNPSASHFSFGKHQLRRHFVTEGSRTFGVGYLYANLIGNEAGRVVYDGGSMIACGGQRVASGPRLSFECATVTAAQFDVLANRSTRSQRTLSTTNGPSSINVPFTYPTTAPRQWSSPPPPVEGSASWEQSEYHKEEEFTRAIALGLFDYLRKSQSKGAVISLSGGADSAACACLFRLSIELAVGELGVATVIDRLRHIPHLDQASNAAHLTKKLLLCVYQKTRHSSQTTENAAQIVADSIGAEYMVLDVDSLVDAYVQMISDSIGRNLNWQNDDIPLQNIQARVRAPGVWLLANLRQSLLLATSNRSEAAVGYATMDGDTAGGLSPIAGIDKAFLLRWLQWLQEHGPMGLFAIPELSCVTNQRPTAELRPPSEHQTDEDDLMPYEVLDTIEGAAIRDKQSPLNVFHQIRRQFPQYSPQQLGEWIATFFRLWCQNQWKRERYAPSFHVDDKNLDPKTWCRFPILSGGFTRELEKLRIYIETETAEPSE